MNNPILQQSGQQLQYLCQQWLNKIGELHPGGCALTTVPNSNNFRYLIHTHGPNWADIPDGFEGKHNIMEQCLRQCVYTALDSAQYLGVTSVALPAISCGYFQLPPQLCATVTLSSIKEWASVCQTNQLTDIRIVLEDAAVYQAFMQGLWALK